MSPRLSNLIMVVFSLVLAALLAEAGFRVWIHQTHQRQIESWRHDLYQVIPESAQVYRLRPGAVRVNKVPETGSNWRYRINNDGFRGDDLPTEGAVAGPRIAFLGDSYTFGWAVDQADTLPRAVTTILRAPPFDLPVTSINLGIPGYNTEQELSLLKDKLPRYIPDLVVLGYVVNDAEPQHNVPAVPATEYRYVRSWLLAFLLDRINATFLGNESPIDPGLNRHTDYRRPFLEGGAKLADARAAFDGIADLCKRSGIPLIVVTFPDFTQPFDSSYPYEMINDAVLQWSRQQGIPALDMLAALRNTDHRDWWVEGDGHPNAAAFRRTAELLSPIIARRLQLPASD